MQKTNILHLPYNSIRISPNRQRREFDEKHLNELVESIRTDGLHQPIIVRQEGDEWFLVAGERRMRALRILFPETPNDILHIPCINKGELDPITRERVELEENTIRKDLTWKERTDALARLHNLLVKEAELRGESHSKGDTALHVYGHAGSARTSVRNATLLQNFMDDPDVAKSSSEVEAMNIVRKKLSAEFTAVLAERTDNISSMNELREGDCREVLPILARNTYDCIITDPPFGINAHLMQPMSKSDSGVQHEYDDTFQNASKIWYDIFQYGFQLCKPDAALHMFYDFRHDKIIRQLARNCGWTVWPTPIIWYKPSGGNLGDSLHGPRKSYELILFCYKGNKQTTGVYSDVITLNNISNIDHAAAKPVDLYCNLLRRSTIPGMKVLDPCAGSGTIFPAARALSLLATGIESNPKHINTCKLRLTSND